VNKYGKVMLLIAAILILLIYCLYVFSSIILPRQARIAHCESLWKGHSVTNFYKKNDFIELCVNADM